MRNYWLVAAGIAIVASGRASAQTTCNGGIPANTDSVTANARMQAADLFQYMAPQIAQALVGGNATLGQSSTVGGLGHFSVGVHGTVVAGSVPDVSKFPTCYTNAQRSTLPTTSQVLGLPSADAAIGIFGGLPLALTNVGGLDLLVSASYVPELNPGSVRVRTPDGSLQLGYGARLGLLSESIIVPGVSLSILKRDLPRVNVFANTSGSDTLAVNGLKVKTTAWRLVASKSLILFGLAAGVGQDKLESSVDSVTAVVSPTPATRSRGRLGAQSQSLTRTNYFLDVSLNLLLAKITAEIGQSTGGAVNTFNSFSGSQAAGARTYGSLGVRLGF
jgi:hypothetical protein